MSDDSCTRGNCNKVTRTIVFRKRLIETCEFVYFQATDLLISYVVLGLTERDLLRLTDRLMKSDAQTNNIDRWKTQMALDSLRLLPIDTSKLVIVTLIDRVP